jgi:hypothetical protein
MKTISSSLQTFLLNNTSFGRADLLTLSLPNGQVLNIACGVNFDIVYSGTRYYCSLYGVWQRSAFTNKADFKPSSESFQLIALIKETVLYPGTSTPMMQVINSGLMSGGAGLVTVSIQVLYWPQGQPYTAGVSMGTMQLTVGQIGSVKPAGRSKVEFEVFDLLYILNRPVPPHSIQTSCRHVLFDAGCTLSLANYISTTVPLDSTSTVLYLNLNVPTRLNAFPYSLGNLIIVADNLYRCTTAGSSAGSPPTFNSGRAALTQDGGVVWTSMNQSYPLGYVLFTSGQNAGLKWSIKVQTLSSGSLIQLQLIKPLPFPVAVGDELLLVPGCDKSLATCQNVFNNLIHFGGQPMVPNPEVSQ